MTDLDYTKLETDNTIATGIGRFSEIEYLIDLLGKGNPSSLAKLRKCLGKTEDEISSMIGVSSTKLVNWESGEEKPSHERLISWKVKLGNLMDAEISSFLGTTNQKLIARFCDIIYHLNLK